MEPTVQQVGVVRGPNLNPSPKTRFRESGTRISDHRKMVESVPFVVATDFALLEYQAQLGMTVSENSGLGGVAGIKMTGALEFVQVLKTLSEQPSIASRTPVQNLDHKA